jgi:hypothetical protein
MWLKIYASKGKIWFSSIFELLFERSEKAVEFMILTPMVPTVGAN